MSVDVPDNVYYALSGQVSDDGTIDLKLPLRRFPKLWKENKFFRLPFLNKGKLPEGLEAQPFLYEHFLTGARYVEEIFFRPCVSKEVMEHCFTILTSQRK